MHRTGTVAALNPAQRLVAIEAKDGGYAIVEMLSGFALAVGDEVMWENGHDSGFGHFVNSTTGIHEDVYVQHLAVSKADLHRHLFI